jgi:hypothetical protein
MHSIGNIADSVAPSSALISHPCAVRVSSVAALASGPQEEKPKPKGHGAGFSQHQSLSGLPGPAALMRILNSQGKQKANH